LIITTLFKVPIYLYGETEISDLKKATLVRGYDCFEKFLTDYSYIAGNQLTVADFSVWSILESAAKLVPIEVGKYPKILGYLEKMRKELPFKDLVLKTVEEHIKLVEGCIARNKAAQV
jgi:glutathione S-transferase